MKELMDGMDIGARNKKTDVSTSSYSRMMKAENPHITEPSLQSKFQDISMNTLETLLQKNQNGKRSILQMLLTHSWIMFGMDSTLDKPEDQDSQDLFKLTVSQDLKPMMHMMLKTPILLLFMEITTLLLITCIKSNTLELHQEN